LAASDLERPAVRVAAPAARAVPHGFLLRAASLAALLAAWEIGSRIGNVRALPGLEAVAAAFLDELVRGNLLHHLGVTLGRVMVAFFVAMLLGASIGLAMGRWRSFDLILDGWIVLLLNIPALVVAVLAYIWLGLTEAAAIGAVALNKLPLVAVTMREGARSLERDYAELATVFRIGAWRRLRHVLLPQLAPFFMVATRSGLSLIWKIVLVVELLGRSDGIGFQLQLYFQLFDVARILAYALSFVAVVQLIEWAILQPLDRGIGAWRR
jgi:NitT/TauT family transport system permease protein